MKMRKSTLIYLIAIFLLISFSFSCWDNPTKSNPDDSSNIITLKFNAVADSLGSEFIDTIPLNLAAGTVYSAYAKSYDLDYIGSVEVFYFNHLDSTSSKKTVAIIDTTIDSIVKIGEISLNISGKVSLIYTAISNDSTIKNVSDTIECILNGVAPNITVIDSTDSKDSTFIIKELDTLKITFKAEGAYPGSTPYFTSIENLPLGASFDSVSGVFSYIPDTSVASGDSSTTLPKILLSASDNSTPPVLSQYPLYITVQDSIEAKDITPPVITLIGNNPDTIIFGTDTYLDPGATAYDSVDGLITFDKITVIGSVNTNSIGSYQLTYSVSDNSGNAATPVARTVVVIDTTAPIITLLGDNPQTILVGAGEYADPGAYAEDNADSIIPFASFTVSGTVNKSVVDSYTITYNVSDASGNAAIPVNRTVIVSDLPDTEPPVITINPDETSGLEQKYDTVVVGASYTVPPAIANDNKDGLISNDAITKNPTSISTSTIGDFKVTYSVSDAAGNIGYDTLYISVIEDVNDTIVPVTLNDAINITYKNATFTWSKSVESDFSFYRLCFGTTAGVLESSVDHADFNNIATLTHTLSGLQDNTTYYAKVFVYNTDNEVAGSNEISFTTVELTTPIIAVSAPTINGSDEAIMSPAASTIKFTVSSPAISPDLQVSASFNSNSITPTFNSTSGEWEFSISSVNPNIKAFNDVKISVNDSKQTVTKDFKVYYKPALTASAAPTVTDTANTSISLSWTSPQNCTNHILYRSLTGEADSYSPIFNTTLQNYTDTGLDIGVDYWYTTRSFYQDSLGSLIISDTTPFSSPISLNTKKTWQSELLLNNPVDIVKNSDGGYTILCSNNKVAKISKSGKLLWNKEITPEVPGSVGALAIIESGDKGYIISGMYRTIAEDKISLIKIDSNANKVWERKLTGTHGQSLAQAPDGGFIITGKKGWDFILVKVDTEGMYEWSNIYNHTSDCEWSGSKVILSSSLDEYVVVGKKYENAYFARFNLNGVPIFQDSIRPEFADTVAANSIIETNEGYVIAATNTSLNTKIAALIEYNKSDMTRNFYENYSSSEKALSLVQSDDAGFILAGDTDYDLLKVNNVGTYESHKAFDDFSSIKILKESAGAYIVLGTNNSGNIVVLRTDENLNIE